MKYLLLFTILISFNGVMADNHGPDRKLWAAKLKLDLAKMKGPPPVSYTHLTLPTSNGV